MIISMKVWGYNMRLQCQKNAIELFNGSISDIIETYRTTTNHNSKEFLYGRMMGILTAYIDLGLISDEEVEEALHDAFSPIEADLQFERDMGW